jgi:S-(hydroxymethyl)glutathione dehydrogenase/alcohol dehydrogenase
VGAAGAYNDAPRYIAKGGKVVMVGMPPSGAMSQYEPGNFAATGQSLIGSKMGDAVIKRDIPWMIDLYAQGRLKLNELISEKYSLDEINEAIEATKTGTAKRNVIVF